MSQSSLPITPVRSANGLGDWPALDRLERFSDFLARLGSLPPQVGPIDLSRLRDTRLPLHESWPARPRSPASLSVGRAPPEVDPVWLAAAFATPQGTPGESLLGIVRQLRGLPEWTLTAIWLLECALAEAETPPPNPLPEAVWGSQNPSPQPPPRSGEGEQERSGPPSPGTFGEGPLRYWGEGFRIASKGALLGELGDLYCQTGDIIQGVQLLGDGEALLGRDDPERWTCALRAARWIAAPNPLAATGRLAHLQADESAPPAVRLHAALELLGHERETAADTHALMERARQADELVRKGSEIGLAEADLRALRTRAGHLAGLWLGASRIRPLRVKGRDRLLEALHEYTQADDFRGVSHILDALGRSHLRLGSFRHARNAFEESIALKQKLRDLWGLGPSLTGLAECLLAAGQAQESLPYFQVNLLLLEALGGMQVLFVRNLARHLNALVASGCDPLETTPASPDLLALAHELLERYTSFIASAEDDPFCLLLGGGYRRLAARNAGADEERLAHVAEGARQGSRARDLFARQGNWLRVAEADRTLAALLLDRAAGSTTPPPNPLPETERGGRNPSPQLPLRFGEGGQEVFGLPLSASGRGLGGGVETYAAIDDLAGAREALEEADQHQQGEVGRVQGELLWARYHQLAGRPYQMQLHLAAARRAAEASGYQALALGVDARLGVQLSGPTGPAPAQMRPRFAASEPDEVVVAALPGETVPLEIRASDWRDRPLPAYLLHGVVEPEEGPCPSVSSAGDGPPGAPCAQACVRTDHLGRACFEIHAREPSRSIFRAATPDGVHALALRVVVRPMVLEWAADLAPEIGELNTSRLLRQLFGPSCPRLRIARAFASGHSGTRVLLIEPFRDGEQAEEMRGQPCIVKIGPRSLLEDERRRYLRWVKDLLPLNISRLDGFTVWNDRAALRMSLVGDVSRGLVREAREWLAGAAAFDAHLLLERVFVGDLSACWYANSPRLRESTAVEELYGPMIPALLHLVDATPARGLAASPPLSRHRSVERGERAGPLDDQPASVCLTEGLRHPAARSFRTGDEVVVAEAALLGCRQTGENWEYELQAGGGPLRFTFRTPLSPELLELDGAAANGPRLVRGVRGIVESTAHDRLAGVLRRCCEVFNQTHAGQSVTLSDDERFLLVQTAEASRRLSNPLDHLARLSGKEIPCNWSLIHGDLHGRNILVSPQGEPFYIDFARTGYGPTVFDFLKFEVYLWHESFAGWPHGEPPTECNLTQAVRLLEDFSSADPARHFPSPYARRDADRRGSWLALFRQCLATLRSAARPHVVDPGGRDYFLPLALYAGLMLRWCDPSRTDDERQQRRLARQGVVHALASASLVDGVLAP